MGLPFDKLFKDSNCVSCGNCVSVCPTGALTAKAAKSFRIWEVTKTRTTCPYCGVGCQMDLLVKNGEVVGSNLPTAGPTPASSASRANGPTISSTIPTA